MVHYYTQVDTNEIHELQQISSVNHIQFDHSLQTPTTPVEDRTG